MTKVAGLFNFADRIQMEALNQNLARSQVLMANIANAETPGYRALGYDFEAELQAMMEDPEDLPMKAVHKDHYKAEGVWQNGELSPDVYVRPSESVGEDGNTVDVDKEMGDLAQGQIKYRATVELLNRKIGNLRYAIQTGNR